MSGTEEEHAAKHDSELAALSQVRAELEKLSTDELMQQNIVAIDALATVRGVLRELMGLRSLMLKLPDFNAEYLDRLELYAMAFAGAHAQYQILKEHNKEPAALVREGLALRCRLVNDIKVLVRRGLIAPEALRKLHNQRSYAKVASDLLLLAALFHTHASVIAGKCAATAEEIARADTLADKLTVVVSHRRKPLEAEVEALEVRRRAFTAFFRAYSQVRRAVQYLRYDAGDAERFAPPLTGKRKRAKKMNDKSDAAVQPKPAEHDKPTELASGIALAKPTAPSAVSSTVAVSTEEVAPRSTSPIGVGLPGSDPFLH